MLSINIINLITWDYIMSEEIAILGGIAIIGIGCIAGIVAGVGAINGILGGCIASFISGLSPLIVGGMIGLGGLTLLCLPLSLYYIATSEKKIAYATSTILPMAVSFGIGAGLVALGFTSPAAIGALTALAGIPLGLLINKAFECFSSKENEQLGGFLGEGVDVEGKQNNIPCPSGS